jgi:hypothetical protein
MEGVKSPQSISITRACALCAIRHTRLQIIHNNLVDSNTRGNYDDRVLSVLRLCHPAQCDFIPTQ